ncbi:MAG: Dna2/Cas4 domain-containing protein [Nitrososphaeraceae archaeon]|nr:Dna2/Cas4 domain-containing protein [Nitrososphaeraceae archaeon]
MVNNQKENEKIHWKSIEEQTNSKDAWTTAAEIAAGSRCPTCGYIGHEVHNEIQGQKNTPNYIALMQEAMEEWFSKPREGFHVSDVCLCPRQKVFRKIDQLPIDVKTVSIYSAGKAMHEAIQLLFLSDKRTFEREKYVEYDDIQGSVDIYDRRRNIPLEFKTSRASDIKEPKSFHVEQLKYYMAMLAAPEGYILYQLLMHFGQTPFKSFRITMNAQERINQRERLVMEINSLKRAMEAGDPSLARSVRQDLDLQWMCKDCPYSIECKRMESAAAAA